MTLVTVYQSYQYIKFLSIKRLRAVHCSWVDERQQAKSIVR